MHNDFDDDADHGKKRKGGACTKQDNHIGGQHGVPHNEHGALTSRLAGVMSLESVDCELEG